MQQTNYVMFELKNQQTEEEENNSTHIKFGTNNNEKNAQSPVGMAGIEP
jgi:hypothetical protein